MKVALLQLATRETPEETLAAALPLLQQAHSHGASLAMLPELFSSGYRYADAGRTPWVLQQLWEFCKQHPITVVAGVLEADSDKFGNRARVIGPNGEMASYTKLHLIPAFNEPTTMMPGQDLCSFSLGGFEVGLSICFDLRFPELYRLYASEGVDLFLVPSAWPKSREAAWELLCRARAAENQAYLLAVNHAEEPFGAPALAVNPMGEVIGRLEGEGLLLVDLDPTWPKRLRQEFRVLSERRIVLERSLLRDKH